MDTEQCDSLGMPPWLSSRIVSLSVTSLFLFYSCWSSVIYHSPRMQFVTVATLGFRVRSHTGFIARLLRQLMIMAILGSPSMLFSYSWPKYPQVTWPCSASIFGQVPTKRAGQRLIVDQQGRGPIDPAFVQVGLVLQMCLR